MAYTLDSEDLGYVESEQHNLTSDIQPMPMPASGSSGTLAFDFSGVVRRINVSSRKTFDTQASMMDFITTMEAKMTGAQTGYTYHSDRYDESTSGEYTDGNFTVFVTGFTSTQMMGEELVVTFSLQLLEASV